MTRLALYRQLAKYYDKFYNWKKYEKEVDFFLRLFDRYGVRGRSILELACGTGTHAKLFADHGYYVTGTDLNEEMLRLARRKVHRNATFLKADMRNIGTAVGGQYDAVLCLFSSIEYNKTLADFRRTVQGMYDRTKEGGVAAFDNHFLREAMIDLHKQTIGFREGKLRGTRFSLTRVHGKTAKIYFDYIVSDGKKAVEVRNDIHEIGLFTFKEMRDVMVDAGFSRVDVFGDFTFKRMKEADEKVRDYIFVGKKK